MDLCGFHQFSFEKGIYLLEVLIQERWIWRVWEVILGSGSVVMRYDISNGGWVGVYNDILMCEGLNREVWRDLSLRSCRNYGEWFTNYKVGYCSVLSPNELTYVLKHSIYFGLLVHSQEHRLIKVLVYFVRFILLYLSWRNLFQYNY